MVTWGVVSSLRDPAPQVRKTAGLVMTHLILKDMVKVKGQVSEMAVLLIDPVPQIAALAKNFFNELSHKVSTTEQLQAALRPPGSRLAPLMSLSLFPPLF